MIEIETNINLDSLLGIIFHNADPSDLIRLVAESRTDYGDVDYFFTKRASSPWHWPPGATVAPDVPSAVVHRNQDTIVRFSPLLYQRSPMRNAPACLVAAYAVLPVRLVPSRASGLEAFGSIDATSEREALARLAACTPQPTLTLHEGGRLSAFWRLREPIPAPVAPLDETRCGPWKHSPEAQAQGILWNLTLKVGGDRNVLNPRTALFQVPGTPMAGIFPRREVAVILGNDVERRFSIDEL